MMSSLDLPAGTIGYTFSRLSVRKSITTGRSSVSFAFWMAARTSLGARTRTPPHPRPASDLVGPLDGGVDLLGRLDAQPHAAHGLGPELVVGQVGRQVHLAVALVVEHLLPLADHAQVGVVEDRDLDRD